MTQTTTLTWVRVERLHDRRRDIGVATNRFQIGRARGAGQQHRDVSCLAEPDLDGAELHGVSELPAGSLLLAGTEVVDRVRIG
jgi:hypothetical protein